MAWNTSKRTTRHTCNDGRPPVFGRKTPGCPRCDELLAGAAPIVWGPTKAERDLARSYRLAHDCVKSGCLPICTFGDW
jgi:hypothetical protein